jgi:hypothetical protein
MVHFRYVNFLLKYRMAQKPVNLKHYFVLQVLFRFTPASQCSERYHNLNWVLRISFRTIFVNSISNKGA